MQHNDIFFPQNIYLEHLTTVSDVKFTHREIDIIACLLNGRGTSRIASFLSISPKTVVNHIHNIMIKLECNSREKIIDFFENSNKLQTLRNYYSSLIVKLAFDKSLKEILKLKNKENCSYLILYWKNPNLKDVLMHHLSDHLNQVGIKALVQEQGSNDDGEKAHTLNHVLLLLEKVDHDPIPPEDIKVDYIDLSHHETYYFSVFDIIKKILPYLNIDPIILDFKKKYEELPRFGKDGARDENEKKVITEQPSHKIINELGDPKRRIVLAFIFFCIVTIGVISIKRWEGEIQNYIGILTPKEANFIRSDLIIPTESSFLDRAPLLAQIKDKFQRQDKNGIKVLALVGMGGAGKTTLARHYAQGQKLSVVWEINAESKASLFSSFENLAQAFAKNEQNQMILKEIKNLKNPQEKEKKIILFVKENLRTNKDWFLIFDNVEKFSDIQKYFPLDQATWGPGKIIVTTRDQNIGTNQHINHVIYVDTLSPQDALQLFTKIINQGNEQPFTAPQVKEAMTFLEKIPPYPLDVSIAAYYLKTTHADYKKYLENLQENTHGFRGTQQTLLAEAGEYLNTRYGIITMSLEHLFNKNKNFEDALLLMCFLSPQNIPVDLLDAYKGHAIISDLISNLKKYSLLTNQHSSSQLPLVASLHQSTQSIILAYLIEKLYIHKNNGLMSKMGKVFDHYLFNSLEYETSANLKDLASHCHSFLKHKNLLPHHIQEVIQSKLGIIFYYLGDYEKSKNLIEKNIDSIRKSGGYDDTQVAWTLAYLGDAYRELGQYEKARSMLEQSFAIYNLHHSKKNREIAWVLTRLGNINRYLGYYIQAKDLIEKAILIYEKDLSENGAKIAWAKTYLASVYKNLGNTDKAKKLLLEILAFYKKASADDNIKVSWVLSYLGEVYIDLGDYEKAEQAFQQSILAYEKKYGKNHLENARILRNIGQVYLLQNQLEKAEIFLNHSLNIFQKDQNHPDRYISLESLSELYLKKSRIAAGQGYSQNAQDFKQRAMSYLKNALEIVEVSFSKNSPHKARIEQKIKSSLLYKL